MFAKYFSMVQIIIMKEVFFKNQKNHSLKAGATNRAIDQAKKNKDNKIPYSLVAKSKQIDDAAKQIEDMLKELE